MSVREMIGSHPESSVHDEGLLRCIERCIECVQTCVICADACLAEEDVSELRRCISLNLVCADACRTTARTLSRAVASDFELTQAVLLACVQACRSCGAECERHSEHHEHCRICAETCRRCASACEAAVTAMVSPTG